METDTMSLEPGLLLASVLGLFAAAGWLAFCIGHLRARNALSGAVQLSLGGCIAVVAHLVAGRWFWFELFDSVPSAAHLAGPAPGSHPLFALVSAPLTVALFLGAAQERLRGFAALGGAALLGGIVQGAIGGLVQFGFLQELGFVDFAGASWCYLTAGAAALSFAIAAGPRVDKYAQDGTTRPLVGHNLPLSSLGLAMFLAGALALPIASRAGVLQSMAPAVAATLATIAAASLGGALFSRIQAGRMDLSLSWSGALSGLAAAAGAAEWLTPAGGLLLGFVAGLSGAGLTLFAERRRIDDPTGSAVALVCGALLGLFCAGLIAPPPASVAWQVVGGLAIAVIVFIVMLAPALLLKRIGWLRVSEETELRGLDLSVHGHEAYSGFQIINLK